ncbi:hypothetical protein ACFQZC_36380 [Streptacidiphilus monticola]
MRRLRAGRPAGSLSSSLSSTLRADWSLSGGATAAVSVSAREASSLTAALSGAATCTLTTTQLGSTRTLGEFTVFIGPVPVVVVPRLSFFVRGSVKTTGSVTASAGQDFTATAGLSYAHGTLTPNATAVASSTHQPPTVTGTGRLTVAVSTRLRLDLFGVAGPTVTIDPGLDLAADVTANPWWTLTGTLDAGASLRIPALGINASDPRLFSRRVELAHAAGRSPPPRSRTCPSAETAPTVRCSAPTAGRGWSPGTPPVSTRSSRRSTRPPGPSRPTTRRRPGRWAPSATTGRSPSTAAGDCGWWATARAATPRGRC